MFRQTGVILASVLVDELSLLWGTQGSGIGIASFEGILGE